MKKGTRKIIPIFIASVIILLFIGSIITKQEQLPGLEAQIAKRISVYEAPNFFTPAKKINLLPAESEPYRIAYAFASWCSICHQSLPLLKKLSEDSRIEVIGLTWDEEPGDLNTWLEKYGNPFGEIGRLTSELTFDLRLVRVLVLFIIDGSGSVLYHHQGALDEGTLVDEVYAKLKL